MRKSCVMVATLLAMAAGVQASGKVSFRAQDGLEVSADLYLAHPPEAPFILLCHMAGSGRGEYLPIVERLSKLGFNLMAVDQRSGNAAGGLANETAARAHAKKLSTSWIDALLDMQAALAEARGKYAKGKLLLWGSSYSASLAIKMAGDAPSCCDGVLAFSPGEYFGRDFIASSAKSVKVPVFVTSGKYERDDWQKIYDAIPAAGKLSFLPNATGEHGSPALYPATPGSGEYWAAVEPFLKRFL